MLNGHSQKDQKLVLKTNLSLNAGQKYCRMLEVKHSAIISTFIKLSFVFKIFVLSIFEWPFYIGFTVHKGWITKIFGYSLITMCIQNS